jgi:hypothetical protein
MIDVIDCSGFSRSDGKLTHEPDNGYFNTVEGKKPDTSMANFDPLTIVKKYLLVQAFYDTMGLWITPIGLSLLLIGITINQIKQKTKKIMKIIFMSILSVFSINLIILALSMLFGISGILKI